MESAGKQPEAVVAPAAQPVDPGLADGALDTLANVLRSCARHSFAIDVEDETAFPAECERWARHVLTGASVDPDAPSDENGTRQWTAVGHFWRARRKAEQAFVNNRFHAFRGIIFEFVNGLRRLSRSRSDKGQSIEHSLGELEIAAEGGSLDGIRNALSSAVQNIRVTLEQQRSEFDSQISQMSERLDAMRDDLLAARREMEMDALTRAYNRGAFDTALERYVALANLSGQPLVLMMADLDHFKKINDSFGHPAGDRVLAQAADCINRCFLRRNDFVARYGGEEFGIILFDTDAAHAPRLADSLLSAMRELRVDVAGSPVAVTCSIGYAVLASGESPQDLLARADAALYRAKALGRNCSATG